MFTTVTSAVFFMMIHLAATANVYGNFPRNERRAVPFELLDATAGFGKRGLSHLLDATAGFGKREAYLPLLDETAGFGKK